MARRLVSCRPLSTTTSSQVLSAHWEAMDSREFLLTAAVQRAWAINARRVWVHTWSLDHPAALRNYLARGFAVFREERFTIEAPDDPARPVARCPRRRVRGGLRLGNWRLGSMIPNVLTLVAFV